MVALNHIYQSEDNYQTGLRVEHALIRSYPDRFLGVAATAFYGIIELTGPIASLEDKMLAIQIAEHVPGVTTVVESLRVDQTGKYADCLRRRMGHRAKPMSGHDAVRIRWNND